MARFPVAVALVLAALASSASAASEASLTIRLTSVPTNIRGTEHPPAGPKNDVLVVDTILRNGVAQFGKPKGAVVGKDRTILTLTSATSGTMKVNVTLPGGTLRVRGTVSESTPNPMTLPVVAGTGRFAGATGTVLVRDLQKHSINVYRLQLP